LTTPSPRPIDQADQRARALAAVRGVDGWLTDDQAGRLYDAAAAMPAGGRIVEIGSFRGRSTVVLALAAPGAGEIVAIDPHAGNDRGPQEIHGKEAEAAEDFDVFHGNLRDAGVDERVRHLRRFASDVISEVSDPIDVLYVDGAHRFRPARDDVRDWGARVAPGGHLLVHDAFSSVGVTAALWATVAIGDDFAYVGRSGSLVEYRRRHLDRSDRVRNVGHHLAQMPWFAKNLVIKVAIVTKQAWLARALGHDGVSWPY
jgi:predicted O-methyltransferase YrrM